MGKYNEAEAARLQAIVDADPAIQAAYRAWMDTYFIEGKGRDDARKRAKKNLEATINRNPTLKAAKVAEGTIREGYQWNMGRPKTLRGQSQAGTDVDRFKEEYYSSPLTIGKESSDVGHVVRDMILPAAGAAAIFAAPAIIGSQAASGGPTPLGNVNAVVDKLGAVGGGGTAGGAAPAAAAGTSTMTGSVAGPTTMETIMGAGGGAKGLWGRLASKEGIDAVGGALGKASEGMAANRGAQTNLSMEKLRAGRDQEDAFFRALIDRETMRTNNANDAWRRMQQADYIANRAPREGVSPYTRPLQPISASMRAMVQDPAYLDTVRSRFNYADPFGGEMPARRPDFSEVEKHRKPSAWERLAGYGSTAATIYGGL